MNFNESLLVRRSHELHEREVRIRFIGRRDRIPRVRRRIEEAEELTAGDTRDDPGRGPRLRRPRRAGPGADLAAEVREVAAPARRAGYRPPPVRDRHARRRPAHPDLQRVPDLQLPALADRLRRATSPRSCGPTNRQELFNARASTRAATAASAPSPPPSQPVPTCPPSGGAGGRPGVAGDAVRAGRVRGPVGRGGRVRQDPAGRRGGGRRRRGAGRGGRRGGVRRHRLGRGRGRGAGAPPGRAGRRPHRGDRRLPGGPGVATALLHATALGRPVHERLGFVPETAYLTPTGPTLPRSARGRGCGRGGRPTWRRWSLWTWPPPARTGGAC